MNPKSEPTHCAFCEQAKVDPYCGLYRSACLGCATRQLAAASPAFHESAQSGRLTPEYQKALVSVFGEQAAAQGHQAVKREAERIKALRAQRSLA
jgi:Ni,Fe-hydrogenase I small subunit